MRLKDILNEEKVYIDFLNKAKGFKQDRIKFNSYEDAVKWARKNFDKFSPDMIKYESVKEATLTERKYYVTYNKGRGQGKGLEKEFDQKTFSSSDKPKVFNSYNDAKKYAEKMEKMFRNSIGGGTAYWVSDEKMNPINESINEGRGIKSIQSDLNKTIAALESEISDYKLTKGTPQEKKHIDNLKKLHPIKKKLEAELEMVVSGLYRDAELKIED